MMMEGVGGHGRSLALSFVSPGSLDGDREEQGHVGKWFCHFGRDSDPGGLGPNPSVALAGYAIL